MSETEMNGDATPRSRTRGEERVAEIKTPSRSELLERIEALERELEATKRSDAEHRSNWHRSAADFANYKRRTDEERANASQFAATILVGKLLAVLDDFDRALDSVPADASDPWVEGVRLTERKLRNVLESEGVTPIEAIGQAFDPNVHEAVVHEETTEAPDNHVIAELQRGYRLHDRVLRPALVKVANNPRQH
jgi:molecular chaperone GrpE